MRVSLLIAMVGAGLLPIMPLLQQRGPLALIPYIHLAIFLPALVASLPYAVKRRGPWTSLAVVAPVGLMAAGLLWVNPSEQGRGMIIVASVATAVAVAAGIAATDAWFPCARAFVIGTALSCLVLLALWLARGMTSFGVVYDTSLTAATNRNAVGAQLACAALLAIILRAAKEDDRRGGAIWTLIFAGLSTGVVLTGSRGAFLSLAGTLVIAMVARHPKARLRGWSAFFALWLMGWAVVALIVVPNPVMERLREADTRSIGDRAPIWDAAIDVLETDTATLVHGVGTGGVDRAIAPRMVDFEGVKMGDDGVLRLFAHNAYVEWIVQYGIIGIAIGLAVVLSFARASLRADRVTTPHIGTTLLVFLCLISMSTVAYRSQFAIAIIALFLAHLSYARAPANSRHVNPAVRPPVPKTTAPSCPAPPRPLPVGEFDTLNSGNGPVTRGPGPLPSG